MPLKIAPEKYELARHLTCLDRNGFAEKANIHPVTVSRVESNGVTPGPQVVQKWQNACPGLGAGYWDNTTPLKSAYLWETITPPAYSEENLNTIGKNLFAEYLKDCFPTERKEYEQAGKLSTIQYVQSQGYIPYIAQATKYMGLTPPSVTYDPYAHHPLLLVTGNVYNGGIFNPLYLAGMIAAETHTEGEKAWGKAMRILLKDVKTPKTAAEYIELCSSKNIDLLSVLFHFVEIGELDNSDATIIFNEAEKMGGVSYPKLKLGDFIGINLYKPKPEWGFELSYMGPRATPPASTSEGVPVAAQSAATAVSPTRSPLSL